MGQKVNPYGLRLGIVTNWKSVWYDEKDYQANFLEDQKIRNFFKNLAKKNGKDYGISDIVIERFPTKVNVNIFSSRPGMIFGTKGSNVEIIKKELQKIVTKNVNINIKPVKRAEINAQLVAKDIANLLLRRMPLRRVAKQAISNAMQAGCKGIKIKASGRLGGAEMARIETYKEGRIPLHTLRANIEYGFAESPTTFGLIGIKVWIYKGDIFEKRNKKAE